MTETQLTFSFDPGLDLALSRGWALWVDVARKKGIERTAEWLLRRDDLDLQPEELEPLLAALLASDSPFEIAMAASELAEYVEGEDDAVAAVLWEGMLISGRDANDAEVYYEGLSHLADIEHDYGDPQAAAALYLDFLNWIRETGHPSEAETIFNAFDRVIAFAEADDAPKAAAEYGRAQAQFFQFVAGDDDRIVAEDWAPGQPPFTLWQD